MGHVRSITQKVAAVDAAARQEVSTLLQNLLLRLTALERYEDGLSRLATEAATEQLTQVREFRYKRPFTAVSLHPAVPPRLSRWLDRTFSELRQHRPIAVTRATS